MHFNKVYLYSLYLQSVAFFSLIRVKHGSLTTPVGGLCGVVIRARVC